MDINILEITFIIAAYLIGSLSAAVITSRLMGLEDPRTYGSKNPGATNVLREGGKKAAVFTLLGDCIKGVIPVLVARYAGVEETVLAWVALAAFIGHCFPVFFGFKGGKGVATALGVYLALAWQIGLILLGIWLFMAVVFRISSLSALVAACAAPAVIYALGNAQQWVIMSIIMSLLLVWRHRSNIQNLLSGKEERIASGDKDN